MRQCALVNNLSCTRARWSIICRVHDNHAAIIIKRNRSRFTVENSTCADLHAMQYVLTTDICWLYSTSASARHNGEKDRRRGYLSPKHKKCALKTTKPHPHTKQENTQQKPWQWHRLHEAKWCGSACRPPSSHEASFSVVPIITIIVGTKWAWHQGWAHLRGYLRQGAARAAARCGRVLSRYLCERVDGRCTYFISYTPWAQQCTMIVSSWWSVSW